MWRLILIELLVVLMVAGIWLLGPYVGLKSVLARLGVILLLLLPPLAFLIVKLLQRRKDAKGLEAAIKEQGQQEARPDKKEEIALLNQQFDEAIGALRASKLGKGSPLYALPWYMIIGPPGAGKSTALLRSGLNFPFTTGDKAIKGVGGTRNCDWWFSDEAILLDTAGRYTLEEEDREEWVAFLRMLKRYRSKQPLNGLIVCVSIAELLANPAEQNKAIAAQVRKRVDELLAELELTIPVYVLFSKCDLVSGFVESFGQMKRSTRGQVLGFTVPLTNAESDLEQIFSDEFSLLTSSLRQRALAQLPAADMATRPGVYGFPLQLDDARETLLGFIQRLFAADPYHETPRLRGVYFCSGTQEGQPIDRVIARMGQSLGLPAVAQRPQQDAQKSYFLRDVFTKVMFPDKELAGTSSRGVSRKMRFDLISVLIGVVAAAAVLGLTLISYSNNAQLVASSVELAKSSRVTGADEPAKVIASLEKLQKLATRLETLDSYNKNVPWNYGFGYYSGRPLAEPLRRVFAKQMKLAFVTPVASELEANLADIANPSSGATTNVVTDYELLKTYIMITSPKKYLDVRLASARLVELWKKRLNPVVAQKTDLLNSLSLTFMKLVKSGHARWLSADADAIRDVRRALRQRDVEYRRLVTEAKGSVSPLTLRDILRGRVQTIVTSKHSVPGIYTRAGWKLHMSKRLSQSGGLEPWVLGEGDSATDVADRLRKRYFEQYTRAWNKFLSGLALERTANIKEALKLLEHLTDTPPLYQTLFGAVAYQTEFPSAAAKASAASKLLGAKGKKLDAASKKLGLGKAAERRKKKNPVEVAFAPLKQLVSPPPGPDGKPQVAGLKQYLDQLTAVKDAMAAFVANPDKPDAAPLNKALGDARRVTTGVLSPLPSGLRSQLSGLFFQPLMGAASQAKEASAALTGSSFATEVCEAFDEKLRGRYPFANSGRDALLQDASDFFSPSGTAWTFYNGSLKAQLLRKGDSFTPATGTKVPANVVAFYRRAWIVSRALFARGSEKAGIRFEVRPQPAIVTPGSSFAISEITLEVGTQKKTYRNGPTEVWNFEWPKGATSARLIVRGSGGLREELSTQGDWALMKLIDRGKVRKRQPWYHVVWMLRGGKIKAQIDFRPSRTHNPLFERMKIRCR